MADKNGASDEDRPGTFDSDLAKQSIQARARDEERTAPMPGIVSAIEGSIFLQINSLSDDIPPWSIFPSGRDLLLRRIARDEPMLASAIFSRKTRMQTMGFTVQSDIEADQDLANDIITNADFGKGYVNFIARIIDDLSTCDNGAFIELLGGGNPAGELFGPITGIAHIDSRQCWRTFDPNFPVIYNDPVSGLQHRIHHSRVLAFAENPSPVERARGIGYSPVSRALRMVRIIRDTLQYRDEKVSGRFNRAIGWATGVTSGRLQKALSAIDEDADSKGMVMYRGIPILTAPGSEVSEIKMGIMDLASIPDGFDFDKEMTLYAYILAFAFGVDAREFWPATTSGATKADATVQHQKAKGRGIGAMIALLEWVIRQVIPPSVTFKYDFTDDEQDLAVAQVHALKVTTYATLKGIGSLTPEQVLALSIADGIVDMKVLETMAIPTTDDSALDEDTDIEDVDEDDPDFPPDEDDEDNPDDDEDDEGEKGLRPFEEGYKTRISFGKAIQEIGRGLWRGGSKARAIEAFESVMVRGLDEAWTKGALECGVAVDERTDEEQAKLDTIIKQNLSFTPALADWIKANSKAKKVKFAVIASRLFMWEQRYAETVSQAKLMACANKKLKWVLGPTEHCDDCLAAAGRVHRGSVWDKNGWATQSENLQCTGRRCQCDLEVTDDPLTPGRPPKLKGPGSTKEKRKGKGKPGSIQSLHITGHIEPIQGRVETS